MTDERTEARRLVDRLVTSYNDKQLDDLVALYDPDARYWSALGDWKEGRPAVKEHLAELFRLLPDEQMSAKAVITDGELIVVEFESTGTRDDGRPYAIDFTEVIELREGLISSVQVYLDPEEIDRVFS